MISPAASAYASSKAFSESASALVDEPQSEYRAYSTKAGGFGPYLPDFENVSAKAGGFMAPYEPDFENHPDLPTGVRVSSDRLPSDQALAEELAARAVARATEDATSSAPLLSTYLGRSDTDLGQELAARAVARAMEDATSSRPSSAHLLPYGARHRIP